MIPQETVERILDSAQIADVVGDFVTLKRRGANMVACCPFHNEKTPSFYVSPSKGIYKCFGCGKSGTAVGFVMEQEHCTYIEALRYLARKYNIEIQEKEESAEEIALRQRKESLLLVSEFAQKFYADQLRSGEGRSVGYAYFRGRGIEDETIARFGLGWAPSGRTELVDAAVAAGYKIEYLLDAGLAVKREDGSVADKFRERAMFPVHTVSGRVVAFSGRTLRSDNPAKYVNSPETEIYVKSRNLLGIYFAKGEISRLKKCILVEGNVDMVMMHQLGICNVVASCGTSLTVEQIRLIHRFAEDVTIMYDGDSAGIHAALRGINLVLAEGLNVKIVLLPDGEDPDSFSRKHNLEEVKRFIEENEKDFIAFKTDLLLKETAGDPLKKANLINDIADTIAEIPDPVKRSVYVEATSAKFGIEAQILFDRIVSVRRKAQDASRKQAERASRRDQPAEPAGVPEYVDYGDYPVPEDPRDYMPPVSAGGAWVPENRTVALAEADLLTFLLINGRDTLDFESDSDYYSEEKATVAEFIREYFDSEDEPMANSIYRSIYDKYMEAYDSGAAQEDILRGLLNSPDRRLAAVVGDLSTRKYQLTIEKFENSLTATSSWLTTFVPKAIMVYVERRLQDRIDICRRSLATAGPEREAGILKDLVRLQGAQRKVKQQIGREKKL